MVDPARYDAAPVGGIRLLDGPNFSGRTIRLREAVRAVSRGDGPVGRARPCSYIGPEVFTSFSGLTSTLADELQLYDSGGVADLVEALGLSPFLTAQMAELSGGEEALCALAAALACGPAFVGVDGVLEQLDPTRRARVLDVLGGATCDVLIADSRVDEWATPDMRRDLLERMPVRAPSYGRLDGTATVPPSRKAAGILEVADLSFRYDQRWVFQHLSAVLRPGTVVHLQGCNGAGKSTLAKLLVGALRPQAGHVSHQGVRTRTWWQPGRLAAYHFQNPDVQLMRSSVRAEVESGARLSARPAAEANALVNASVAAFGLEGVLDAHPYELPFSLRKRVALAATFACGAPWTILDEPTLGQDREAAEQLAAYIGRLVGAGAGVILITHSTWFAGLFPTEAVQIM